MPSVIAWCSRCQEYLPGIHYTAAPSFLCDVCQQNTLGVDVCHPDACHCGGTWTLDTLTPVYYCGETMCTGKVSEANMAIAVTNHLGPTLVSQFAAQLCTIGAFFDTPIIMTPPRVDGCSGCGVILCVDLDSYWGQDERGKNNCAPCRRRLGIQ